MQKLKKQISEARSSEERFEMIGWHYGASRIIHRSLMVWLLEAGNNADAVNDAIDACMSIGMETNKPEWFIASALLAKDHGMREKAKEALDKCPSEEIA